ncbi:MAG: patatin-like phospholipase family protein [Hyphomicrobium sp.]
MKDIVPTVTGLVQPTAALSGPTIGLALGGGGARGLAHIAMLEAFDELGLKPSVIAGTSIGAIFGAAYASGLSAKEIRAHAEEVLTVRFDLVRELFAARARGLPSVRRFFNAPAALLAPDTLLDIILPSRVVRDFSQLTIPLKITATDFYGLETLVLSAGSVRQAVSASMCLPAIFEPVILGDRVLLDGGLTNPLPYDLVMNDAGITVAIDVSGAPVPRAHRSHPSVTEALMGSAFIFERSIIREKLKTSQPDIYIDAGTSHFQIFDVFKIKEILAAAAPAKERLKVQLGRVLDSQTLIAVDSHDDAHVSRRVEVSSPAVRLMAMSSSEDEPRAKGKVRSALLKRFKRSPSKSNG